MSKTRTTKALSISLILLTLLCLTININFNAYGKSLTKKVALIQSDLPIKSITWKQTYEINKNLLYKIDLNNDKKADMVELGMDSPNGTKLNVIIGNSGFNLLNTSKVYGMDLFNEDGDMQKNGYIQVAFVDFDKDKKPELVVAAGDGLIDLGVSIFKYTGNKINLYKEIGYIEGQSNITIDKNNHIIAPYGSQGLYTEYQYKSGKIVEVKQ